MKKMFDEDGALRVARLTPDSKIPVRSSALAAGMDLFSATSGVVSKRSRALFPLDIAIQLPPGTYGRIAGRSGLALKWGIDVAAGVIDADYRGPVGVVLVNNSDEDFAVQPGDRIAQLILERIAMPKIVEVDADGLSDTRRGAGGFGSTGQQ